MHRLLDALLHVNPWFVPQHALRLVDIQHPIDRAESDGLDGHVRLPPAPRENPHDPLAKPANNQRNGDRNCHNVLGVDRIARFGADLPCEIPEEHGLVVGDVEGFPVDAALGWGRWKAVGSDEGPGSQDVRVYEVADVHEVVDVLAIAHLVLGGTFLGDGDDLSEVDGVTFAEDGAWAQRDGQHGAVACGAVRGKNFFLRRGFG